MRTYELFIALQRYGDDDQRPRKPKRRSPPQRSAIERAASCEGKRSFKTGHDAWDHVLNKQRPGHRLRRQQAYRCPYCREWHVGSKRPEPKD